MELFKIKDLVFRKEDFLDDISEFEDILPIIEELQDGLTYEEIECVGVNDCCNETNKNYVVEIQGFIDSNDEFITKEELMALENIDEGMLSKVDRLNDICDYIEDILSHIDDYRKIANKNGNGKIFRLD